MGKSIWVILIVAIIAACRTQEYANKGENLYTFSDCSFIGTFSSVSVIKNKKTAEFNDTLTAFADYIYDSVVRSKVKHIRPINITSNLSNEAITGLTQEITRCALVFKKTNSLDSIYPGPVVHNVSDMAHTRYTSFFINYGNIWSKKQQRRHIANKTLVITTVVVGIALIATVMVMAGTTGNPGPGLFNNNDYGPSDDSYEEGYNAGMACYYLIYDKRDRKFCYMRRAFFNSDKTDNNTFNPQRVSDQMDILFGSKTKLVRTT